MEQSKKIGIWGLGIVGKAAVKYFSRTGHTIQVMENRQLSAEEMAFLSVHNATYVPQQKLDFFLSENAAILPSPGIDLAPYYEHQHKWVTELDLLRQEFSGKIIAITGSVGKTTVTHLLSQLINSPEFIVWTGGNIGTGMLDLLDCSEKYNTALLEVSSFQLEHCTTFAPDLAIWTNLYPNHLDRHHSVQEYANAKKKIIQFQKPEQKALVPLLLESFAKDSNGDVTFFSPTVPSEKELSSHKTIYFLQNNDIICSDFGSPEVIGSLTELPDITFAENWLIIVSALHQLGLTVNIDRQENGLILPAHRLEKVATINGVDFYNDSKSTQPAATLAAVEKLKNKKIHLLLGGKSKGIDRTDLIAQLKKYDICTYAFGAEASQLQKMCDDVGVACKNFPDMQLAFLCAATQAHKNEIVLCSPAGSSFDLFKNFEERGECFGELVDELVK